MAKVCRFLGQAWLTLACLVMLLGYGMVWYKDGFSALQGMLSPFNVVNYVAVAVTLSPGLGLLALAEWIAKRRRLAKKVGLPDSAA